MVVGKKSSEIKTVSRHSVVYINSEYQYSISAEKSLDSSGGGIFEANEKLSILKF